MTDSMLDNRDLERFWSHVDTSADCWIWRGTYRADGYGQFFVSGRRLRAHRVAFELSKGPIPSDLCICHRCDNPACVRPSHLFLGTIHDNINDRHIKGRSTGPRGANNAAAKLSGSDVLQIRLLHAEGLNCVAISRLYPVGKTTVQKIIRRETWTHVA